MHLAEWPIVFYIWGEWLTVLSLSIHWGIQVDRRLESRQAGRVATTAWCCTTRWTGNPTTKAPKFTADDSPEKALNSHWALQPRTWRFTSGLLFRTQDNSFKKFQPLFWIWMVQVNELL